MPIVTLHHVAGAFDQQQQADMIRDITDAVVRQGGEGIRPSIQVVISEYGDGLWGVGGNVLTIGEINRRRETRKMALKDAAATPG